MAKKFNNKTLIIILVVLIAIFLIENLFRSDKTERTFRTELVGIDTIKVSSILLYPQSENGEEIKFTKQGVDWTVQKGSIISEGDNNAIASLISTILQIKPQRLAAKSKEKWNDFSVGDSLSTRIKVIEGEATTLDIMIGKFSYKPQQNPYGMQQRNNISGISYVRLTDEDEVYAVDGFLPMTFNQQFNSWRNKTFIQTNKDDITRLTFKYPGDSSFIAVKADTIWMVGDSIADSLKIDQYLNTLSNRNNSSFVDDFIPSGSPLYQLIVEGSNMSPLEIQCYQGDTENDYILHSNLNPNVYFSSKRSGLFRQLFKQKNYFLMQ